MKGDDRCARCGHHPDEWKYLETMSYLESIALIKTLPCLAEPGKIIVVGKPDRPLNEVIPYLATLPGVIAYNPDTCTLTFRRQAGFMTLYPDKVYITQVNDSGEGLALLQGLGDAINATWENRAQLVTMTVARRAPRWLDIWTQLPRTNCKQCGEATCMAFAAALLQQKRLLGECVPLASDIAFADRRANLEAMM
jgi:ArsR family metal-binding transcriptional regulator